MNGDSLTGTLTRVAGQNVGTYAIEKGSLANTNYTITFVLPDGSSREVEAEERYTLLMASQALPSPIGTGRRAGGTCPDGLCALCRVEVIDGTGLTPMGDFEKKSLGDHVAGRPHEGREREPGPPSTPNTRLGCHARIVGNGAKVQVLSLFDESAIQGE